MVRKIYDILPPNSRSERKLNLSPSSSKFNFKKLGLLVGFFVLIISVLGYFFLLRVDIHIWPETEKVEYTGTIEVRTDVLRYDIETGTIPGELFTITKKESRTFSSSGKVKEEKRAEGILRVFNNYSSEPFSLIANTQFVSADGELFRTTERITIPGRFQKEGRTVPGEVQVAVVAAEPGEEFNIERTTNFSVLLFRGTPMFTNIYAENLGPISGGFIGESPKITKEDVESAREILLSYVIEKAEEEMKESADGFIINTDLMEVDITKESIGPEVGEKYDSFDYLLEVEIRNLAFKESKIEEYLKTILLDRLDKEVVANLIFSEMKIWEESLNYIYETDLRSMDKGSISLLVEASALAYPAVRKDIVKREFSGMAIDEVKVILEDYNMINRVEIYPRPPWLKNITSPNRTKINIKINYEG